MHVSIYSYTLKHTPIGYSMDCQNSLLLIKNLPPQKQLKNHDAPFLPFHRSQNIRTQTKSDLPQLPFLSIRINTVNWYKEFQLVCKLPGENEGRFTLVQCSLLKWGDEYFASLKVSHWEGLSFELLPSNTLDKHIRKPFFSTFYFFFSHSSSVFLTSVFKVFSIRPLITFKMKNPIIVNQASIADAFTSFCAFEEHRLVSLERPMR